MRINYRILLLDVAGYILLYFLLLAVSPVQFSQVCRSHIGLLGLYTCFELLFGALSGRYSRRLRSCGYRKSSFQTLSSSLVSYCLIVLMCVYDIQDYSLTVVTAYALFCLLIFLSVQFLYFAYLYASDPEELKTVPPRKPQQVLRAPEELDAADADAARKRISKSLGDKVTDYVGRQIPLDSSNTLVADGFSAAAMEVVEAYRYDAVFNMHSLNDLRGINLLFCTVNRKLPDNGLFVGYFTPKSYVKKRILDKYPKGINWIFYVFFYFYRRVIPKLFLTKRLYYDITKGKNRILSKAEVFGRLYYCGFEIESEKKIGHGIYFVARRTKNPPSQMKRRYGPIIKLNRVGKDGKMFKVYKMRTMYPYSEFLQDYIYKKNNLSEGGKFRHDIRVNTLGRFMRRCWIDELPMIVNLLKGDMKLVGVRPLSRQYFNLYDKELQEKRIKFKPGLLPPFYADMPKTLDEIQASEMRYLEMCERKGVVYTDFAYIWKILGNIIFRHARSN